MRTETASQLTLVAMLLGVVGRRHQTSANSSVDTLSEMKQMIGDREHLQEEFDHMFTKQDIRQMSVEEMAFAWFSSHDTDGDAMLDGTEIYKAVHHSRGHKSGTHDHSSSQETPDEVEAAARLPPGVPPPPAAGIDESKFLGSEDRGAIAFVDQLLMQFDSDNDGRLDYPEYVKSFQQV